MTLSAVDGRNMFHVLLAPEHRRGALAEILQASFPKLIVIALVVRLASHALFSVFDVLDPSPHFLARFLLMFSVTACLLPIWLAHKHVPSFRPWALHTMHLWSIVQYPIEAAWFGSSQRDVWFLFLLCHAISCVFFAFSARKAILMGFVGCALLAIGFMLDKSSQFSAPRHIAIVLLGTPLLSTFEFITSRLAGVVWEKDQKIRELATQNENGLRMLSHDMANIMTVSRDSLEIAMEELEADENKVNKETAAYLEETRFAIVQGIGMLQAVRDYLAVSSGKKDPGIEEFPLADVLRDVVQMWQRPAKKKAVSLALSCRVDRDMSFIKGSRALFTHTIVGNLVSNAIKFSPQKSRILIGLYHDQTSDELVIEVIDQGDGISDARLHSIFDDGGRTSSTGTRGESGTGFGLPLVRATLAMFGGQIWAGSGGSRFALPNGDVAGHAGSTFSCRIPRRTRPAQAHPKSGSSDAA